MPERVDIKSACRILGRSTTAQELSDAARNVAQLYAASGETAPAQVAAFQALVSREIALGHWPKSVGGHKPDTNLAMLGST